MSPQRTPSPKKGSITYTWHNCDDLPGEVDAYIPTNEDSESVEGINLEQ